MVCAGGVCWWCVWCMVTEQASTMWHRKEGGEEGGGGGREGRRWEERGKEAKSIQCG